MSNEPIIAAGKGQRGASTLLLALFVVVVLVTATAGLLFGHKLGYQHGFHSMQTETKQAMINSSEATKELEKLRLSNKIATKQSATAKARMWHSFGQHQRVAC